jgi:hypothetical protein
MRSYFWAHLLDEDTKPFDDEAVFTALMLHDLGLTEHGRRAAIAIIDPTFAPREYARSTILSVCRKLGAFLSGAGI